MSIERPENSNQPLSLLTKEEITDRSFAEKRERRDTNQDLGMYIALDGPSFDPDMLISGALKELKSSPRLGFDWAEDFGRVVVGIHPTKKFTVSLTETSNNESKSFIPISSSLLINPEEVINQSENLNGKNLIILNNKPATIEGITVELIHLLDEVVWENYLKIKKECSQDISNPYLLYKEAVDKVMSEGIRINTLSEDEIIELKKELGDEFPLRIYGSKAVQSIPEIMGGVVTETNTDPSPIDITSATSEIAEVVKAVEKELKGEPTVMVGITLTKKLHIGHMFHIATADLIKNAISAKVIILASNDTGPRVAGMLMALAKNGNLELEDVVNKLRRNEFGEEEINNAYISRDSTADQGVFTLLDENKALTQVTEQAAISDLSMLGFANLVLQRDSECSNVIRKQLINLVGANWKDSGFSAIRTSRGIKVLAKSGFLTATGVSFSQCAEALGKFDSLCLVDGAPDSRDAVDVALSLGLNAFATPGAGAGISGKIGSGSGGELLGLRNLPENFSLSAKDIAKFFVLTRCQTSMVNPSEPNGEKFYDFADNASAIKLLKDTERNLQKFTEQVSFAYEKLDGSNESVTITKGGDRDFIENLPEIVNHLKSTASVDFIKKFQKPKVLKESVSFRNMSHKIQKASDLDVNSANEQLMHLLSQGINTNGKIIECLKDEGFVRVTFTTPSKTVEVNSKFLDVVNNQGYAGDDAFQNAMNYLNKEKFLSIRNNTYFGHLKKYVRIVENSQQLSASDAAIIKDGINFCLERLDFTNV